MPEDPRADIYRDLHGRQMVEQEASNRSAATRILGILFDYMHPQSVIDIGCGFGTWLDVAMKLGVGDARGLEGEWLDRSLLAVDSSLVQTLDLEKPFDVGRKFDLAICLEVAEHLSEDAADGFVESLARHSDVVLFSAAIPHQGGHHHVNEKFPDYWAERFARHALRPLDFIRPLIWPESDIFWFLRQNTLLFAHDRAIDANPKLREEHAVKRALSVVHPEFYLSHIKRARKAIQQHQALVERLSGGGTFKITRLENGTFSVQKLS